jgi:hypothetical protein
MVMAEGPTYITSKGDVGVCVCGWLANTMMPLIAPLTTRWITFWMNLATALVLFLTVLMLIVQKDSWIVFTVTVSMVLLNTIVSIYDLSQQSDYHRQRFALR